MSPILYLVEAGAAIAKRQVTKPTNTNGLIVEAWAQGFMVGSLIIMSCITMANMRRRVLLHKLILIELIFGVWHGFFIFFDTPIYNWWLSVSAIFLNTSWSLHNVIAWIKNKPFLSHKVSLIYIGTVILVQPYWVLEIYANFTYFHNVNNIFLKTRPLEALFRDPWWIFTTISLFYNIKTRYEMSLPQIVRLSPRFAVMLVAMILSICFLIVDICSVTGALSSSLPIGINPFWKLSFVFKCLTDCVVLDDFKTALDRLRAFQIHRLGSFAAENGELARAQAPGSRNDWAALQSATKVEVPHSPSPPPDRHHLSEPDSWSTGNPELAPVEPSKRRERRMSQITESSDELDIAGNASESSITRPQSSWLRDSMDGDYAQACREVTRSSHDTRMSIDRGTGTGKPK